MISGGRLIGRAEDEVESVEREVVSWCLDIFGVEVQRHGRVYLEEVLYHVFEAVCSIRLA